MDCRTAHAWIEDDLDGLLAQAPREELQAHLSACPDCRNRLVRELAVRSALRSMPAPAPDPEFASQAFACAAAVHRRRVRINSSMLIRLAASIILLLAVGFMFKVAGQHDRPEWPVASIRLDQPEEIKLVFFSHQALQNVTLRLEPPEGVELVGFENRREIVWQTDLAQGENLLVLPVIVRNQGGGALTAEIRHGSQSRQFKLRIEVLKPDDRRPEAGKPQGRLSSIIT